MVLTDYWPKKLLQICFKVKKKIVARQDSPVHVERQYCLVENNEAPVHGLPRLVTVLA